MHLVAACLSSNFNELPPYLFAKKELLNQVKLWAKGELKPESELYQYTSYLEYWEQLFKDKNKLRIILAGLEPYTEFIELGQVFDNSRLLATIDINTPIPAHQYISNSFNYIREINVLEGAMDA